MTTWKIKPGTPVQGHCPLCRRTLGSLTVQLFKIDLERQLCRCGRPFNAVARKRLRGWMCRRKNPYTLHEAEVVTEQMRSFGEGLMHPYICPFREEHPNAPYHVGAERKG